MATNRSPLKAAGGPSFETVSIKAQPVKSVEPTKVVTSNADWSAASDAIASIGQSVAGAMKDVSATKNDLELATNQLNEGKGKDQTRLQDRIDKAGKQGKEDKVARLKGRQERKDKKQKSRAEIITAKNVDKKEKTESRRAEKESDFNKKQLEKGGMVTQGYLDNMQEKNKAKNQMDASMQAASDSMSFAPKLNSEWEPLKAEPKTSPVLQKLGSTGKGFKLRAFKNN
jgi:hypothetical protein